MQLISQIQEAADLPVEQVVAAMKKDKRVNQIFKRLEPSDVDDWKTLLATLKYYFFNNQNVIRYVATKADSKYLSANGFKYVRKKLSKNEPLDQWDLEQIRDMINGLNKELEKDVKPQPRSGLTDALSDWIGDRWQRMFDNIARRLMSFPSIRPTKPVVLYRGLLFDEKSLREEPDHHGKLTVGAGVRFLRSVREGTRTVDLEWPEYSAWTHSLDKAIRHATGKTFGDTPDKIDSWKGKLGFVISTLADPKDIVVDTTLTPKDITFVPHDTVILMGGKRTCRLVKRYTPQGEEDVIQKGEDLTDELDELHDMITLMNRVIKPPYPQPQGLWLNGGTDRDLFIELIKPEAAEKIDKVLDQLHGIYTEHMAKLNMDQLNQALSSGHSKTVTVLKQLHEKMTEHVTTVFPKGRYGRGEGAPAHTLPASARRPVLRWMHAEDTKMIGRMEKRYTQWQTGQGLTELSHFLNVDVPQKHHLTSFATQRAWLKEIIDAYSMLIRPIPADPKLATVEMANDTNTWAQNIRQLERLYDIKDILGQLDG